MTTGNSGATSKVEGTKQSEHTPPASLTSDYYAQIGRKGGEAVRAKIGQNGYREMGLRGGAATKERYGLTHYAAIGRKGGLNRGRGKKLREKEA